MHCSEDVKPERGVCSDSMEPRSAAEVGRRFLRWYGVFQFSVRVGRGKGYVDGIVWKAEAEGHKRTATGLRYVFGMVWCVVCGWGGVTNYLDCY